MSSNNNCATAAAGGTGNVGGKSNSYNSYSNYNSNQFKYTSANMAAAAASGGEITAGYESDDDDGLQLTPSFFAPRDPKLDEEVNKILKVVEPSWQVIISFIKAGKQAVTQGNDDPNLTKWSKYLPGVLDAVVKLQEHVPDKIHFEEFFLKLFDIVEVPIHGRSAKRNFDFLSNFRECNELILTVLCAFASLRGGLYFEKEQFKDQYHHAATQFRFQLIAVNRLLLDCSPAPLDGDYDNEEDAPVPAESKAKNWKEYIETMIALKRKDFVKLRQELIFWSQRLKSAINYIDPAEFKKEQELFLQLNFLNFNSCTNNNNNNNNRINNEKKSQMQADSTSLAAIQRKLRIFYQNRLLLSQSDAEDDLQQDSKFEDFFCNLRLKKRQQQGEQQSVAEGEFVSASHLPTRLRSAAHTVLVTGPGGAGKTVALKHICIQQGVEDSVIVFVPLKELRGMPRRIKSIEDIFENCSASAALSEEQIEAIVEKRIPVIFAFDGFDEVHNAQEEDKNIAHFLSDMIDPVKRKEALDPECRLLQKLIRNCDRVIISSREERIASANCNLDSAEARPLVDELAVQLWTNTEVERFCLRFFSNAFKKQQQEQEQQNRKREDEQEQLAKAVRTATNDVISSLASPLMDSWHGLPLAVTLLSQLRSSSENSKNVLDNMSPARAYSLVLEMHWRRSEMRVADRLLRCKKNYLEECPLNLNNGVTPQLFELVLNSAAEASFKQLLSTSSNVTEISFSSSSTSSSSYSNKLPLWAALLRETSLIRVESNNSKATFSHRSWIEFLCARHAATSTTENAIEQTPWDQSKFASVWLLLADFARSGTFEKSLSVQRFSFVVMSKYAEKIKETVKERGDEKRLHLYKFDVDGENSEASISLLARITNIIKPVSLFSELSVLSFSRLLPGFLFEPSDATKSETQLRAFFSSSLVPQLPSESELLEEAKKSLDQLPKLIKRKAVTCSNCKTHFSEAPADWKCNKCNVLMWNETATQCQICNKALGWLSNWWYNTKCCGKCVCSGCIFEEKKVSSDKYFCESCVSGSVVRLKLVSHFNCIESKFADALQKDSDNEIRSALSKKSSVLLEIVSNFTGLLVVEDAMDEDDHRLQDASLTEAEVVHMWSSFSTTAANSFILHLRWLAELCVAEGSLDCFKFIEEKYPEAIFGVFKKEDLKFATSYILSPALARAFDHLDRPSVSACVEYIINKYNVDVQLEDALRVNSLVGVTRAIKKMERDNFSLDVSVKKDVERGEKIMNLFVDAIAKKHFDVVAAMLRCRRDEEGRFLWCHRVIPAQSLQFRLKYLFPQDLQFRVWCEEEKDFETGTLSDLAKLLQIDVSSDMKCEKFDVRLSHAEQHLWIPFFHLFEEVVHRSGAFSLTPSNSPGQLRVLDLPFNETFTDEELASLVGKCTQLEEVDLSGSRPFCTNFTDASLRALATCGSTLRSLNLDGNESCTDVGLAALVSKCTRLEKIDLSGSYTKFTDASLKALASCGSTLRSLNLSFNKSFTDADLVALVSKCTQLEEIDLSGTKFGDASLRALATCGSTLRSLDLSGNDSFTDDCLVALVSKFSQLEKIHLSSTILGDASLRALATCASTLRSLNLRGNWSCTDIGLVALVSKCTRLEEVNLGSTKFTDASLKALATCASTLRSLNLGWNESFTDAGLVALVSKCTQLEKINLSYTKLGDASLRALATCASTLRSLNLWDNKSCTDVGLAALVSKCTQLEEIHLSGFGTKFGDVSLKALAASPSVTQQKPPTLVKIDLQQNNNFTDAGVDALKKAYGDFWSKVEVDTSDCKNIENK